MIARGALPARERVLLVGYGYAGRRFAAGLGHLAAHGAPLVLAGVCERDAARPGREGVTRFIDLAEALDAVEPTVVCVTVNESEHFTVFEALAGHRPVLVLAEKPLAVSPAEAAQAAWALAGHAFSMNLVERFSPIVAACRAWMAAEGPLEPVRVEAFWGKHRIGDARPTIGVLSELIHPIDLAQTLFAPGPIEIERAHGTASDFSPWSGSTLDTVDLLGRTAGVPMLLHSSFVWTRRIRTVTAVLRGPAGETFRAALEFDDPHWDCDRLEITAIAPDGHISPVLSLETDIIDLPATIRGVAKVVTYLDTSVRAWRGEALDPRLVDLPAALALQDALEDIDRAVGEAMPAAGYRTAEVA